MKSLWQKFVGWWQNQKWVITKWIPGAIDLTLQPMIEKEIEKRKQEIINSLNNYSARENSIKACKWLKEKLSFLIPK